MLNVMQDEMNTESKPERLKQIIIYSVLTLVLLAIIGGIWLFFSVRHVTWLAYAVDHTAQMIIEYMEKNEGEWPSGWDDLRGTRFYYSEACKPGDSAHVRVAEKQGKVAGFIMFYENVAPGIVEIGNNAVDPDCQRLGIGTKMYEYALAELKRLGMQYAQVGTGGDASHASARRAYEKAGFSASVPGVHYYCKL